LIMEHGRGFALFTLLVVTVVLCIDQANALKCELVGCRFCVTRRMQTHCSAFCATCPNESQRKEQSPSTLVIIYIHTYIHTYIHIYISIFIYFLTIYIFLQFELIIPIYHFYTDR
ncbi:hypothetical protein T4E_3207, partial [Trichinella pseudospiralis]